MQGNLARPVWGWGQGEIPGPTPPFIGRGKAGCLAVILLTFVGKAHRYHMDPWLYVEFAGAGTASRTGHIADSRQSESLLAPTSLDLACLAPVFLCRVRTWVAGLKAAARLS